MPLIYTHTLTHTHTAAMQYLGFLYHLGKPENKTPSLGFFGFQFLLVFVFVSIPAAIAAKVRVYMHEDAFS
jgi:hypothetical protein